MEKVLAWLNLQANDVTLFAIMALLIAIAGIVFGSW